MRFNLNLKENLAYISIRKEKSIFIIEQSFSFNFYRKSLNYVRNQKKGVLMDES